MSDKPRIAVIGCGYWGPNLIRNFSALQSCEMALVCDASHDRLAHMKSLYPWVEAVTDIQQIWDRNDIDAVAIATPISTHYELARRSLLSGKHTFVEKPMAASAAHCRELIALADEYQRTMMVGHTFVYTPDVRYIKKVMDEGIIGEVYYISAQRLNLGLFQKDINVAWDLAPHDLSIMLYLLNQHPVAVNCQGKAHLNCHEDVTNMSLDFSGGTFATIHSSWLDPNKTRTMTIVGSKGMVVYDDVANEKVRIYDKRVEAPPHYDTFAEFKFSYHYGDLRVPYIRQMEPLRVECQHFIDCMLSGSTPDSSGLEGLKVVQILEAATQSLKNKGCRIEIPALEELESEARPLTAAHE